MDNNKHSVEIFGKTLRVTDNALIINEVDAERFFVRNKIALDIPNIIGIEYLTSIEKLVLNLGGVTKIRYLERLRNLQHLSLSHNLISKVEGLEHLRKLKTLDLQCNNIEHIEGLDNLANLKTLNLSHNKHFSE